MSSSAVVNPQRVRSDRGNSRDGEGESERLHIPIEGGASLAAEQTGEGPAIVLLHGLTATRRYVVMGSRALERSGQGALHQHQVEPATELEADREQAGYLREAVAFVEAN